MAERLGTGLQNLLHRFESGSDLRILKSTIYTMVLFYFSSAAGSAKPTLFRPHIENYHPGSTRLWPSRFDYKQVPNNLDCGLQDYFGTIIYLFPMANHIVLLKTSAYIHWMQTSVIVNTDILKIKL